MVLIAWITFAPGTIGSICLQFSVQFFRHHKWLWVAVHIYLFQFSSNFLYRLLATDTQRWFFGIRRDSHIIWVSLWESMISLHANNKGADQPMPAKSDQHLCYLLSGKYTTCQTLIQLKLFIPSLVLQNFQYPSWNCWERICFHSNSLFITEYSLNDTDSNFWEQIYNFYWK